MKNIDYSTMPDYSEDQPQQDKTTVLDELKALSAVSRIEEMEANLSKDTFVFDELALDGQITLFYAKPNTGKTLFFLRFIMDSIKNDSINGSDVFYINADDHYKGFLTKVKIAKNYGFEMLSPQEAGVNPEVIIKMLDDLSRTDEAKGKIVILDTLKKFVNMMSKSSQSDFYLTLRKLVAKNATVIIAGHANKYPDAEGNLIYEGTSDVMNDIDCAYSINLISDTDGEYVVKFKNEKNRGNNVLSVTYEYLKDESMSYYDILSSITRLDDAQSNKIDAKADAELLKAKYESERLFVIDVLKDGTLNQSTIIERFNSCGDDITAEFSRRELMAALKALNRIDWDSKRGERNALFFTLKKTVSRSYSVVKNGE